MTDLSGVETSIAYGQIHSVRNRAIEGLKRATIDAQSPDPAIAERGRRGMVEMKALAHAQGMKMAEYDRHMSGQDNPTSGMGTGEKALAGVGQGMTSATRHMGNFVGAVPDSVLEEAQQLDKPLLADPAGFAGSAAGQGAMMALPSSAGVAALSRIPSLGPMLEASPAIRGATEGAMQGAVMADPGQSRVAAAGTGAIGGAAIPAALGAGNKMISGAARTPEAQTLIDAGVYPTLGQMKPGGMMSTLENAPIIKQALGAMGVKQNIRRDWMRAVTEAASAPGTQIAPDTAQAMLLQAKQSFQPLYDQITGYPVSPSIMSSVGAGNVSLRDAFKALTKNANVAPKIAKEVNNDLQGQLQVKINGAVKSGNPLDSSDLQQLRSDLRDTIRQYENKTDSPSIAYTKLYKAAEAKITEAMESQLPPDSIESLRLADAHYGDYKTMENAVAKATAQGHGDIGPSPVQVSQEVGLAHKGQKRSSYATGYNPSRIQDLAAAAGNVFQESPEMRTGAGVPITAMLSGLGWESVQHPFAAPLAVAGGLAGMTMKPVRKMMAGATAPQKTISELLTQSRAAKMFNSDRPSIAGLRRAMEDLSASGGAAYNLKRASGPPSLPTPAEILANSPYLGGAQ